VQSLIGFGVDEIRMVSKPQMPEETAGKTKVTEVKATHHKAILYRSIRNQSLLNSSEMR
jgi:hypothetical protein